MKARSLQSDHPISLRSALFRDDGHVGCLMTLPRSVGEKTPFGWVYRRPVSLGSLLSRPYRHMRRATEGLRNRRFSGQPLVSFLWSSGGEDVAVLINEEPWAFLWNQKPHGYTKSARRPIDSATPWDESLFQELFRDGQLRPATGISS